MSGPGATAVHEARILAVDDEPTNLLLLRRLLATDGYRHVTTISDPREMLPLLLDAEPDLILLDLHMPYLDGFTVLEQLRAWIPPESHLPVIVLTADATSAARKRALTAGATDFLTKPFDASEVLLRVRNHLQTRILHQAARSRSQALEGQLASILSAVEEIVWSATPDGRLTFVSDAVFRVTGRAAETFLGRDALNDELVHPDDRPLVASWLDEVYSTGGCELEYRVLCPGGETRWLRSRCRLVQHASGTPQSIDGVSADVTERRLLSEELARRGAQEQIDRAKREMVSIVSHEIRTPLAAFLGFSELLLLDDVTPEERRAWTTTIHDEAVRLTGLVDDFLDVSRIEAGRVTLDLRPWSLRAIVERALATFDGTGDSARFVRQYGDDLPLVLADAEKLAQIVVNLVSNAAKYSPDGGPIEIRTEQTDDEAVRLTVSDTGLGIPTEELTRLFARFHRVDTPERGEIPGTGLGLYICKQLVNLHHGRIWAESAGRGQGSHFHVELPVAQTEAAETSW